MDSEEIRAGLEKLTKDELIKTFPSLELKPTDRKASIIDAVYIADPLEEEIETFKKLLHEKGENNPVLEKIEKPIYIVVHEIKENGILYEKDSEYNGKFPERFLGDQIRIKG